MSSTAIKVGLLAVALVVGVVTVVRYNQVVLPEGPVEVVWDREVCGHCKMHVGDPRFAAQLQTEVGDVLSFDDPGCMFEYLSKHDVTVHALYFRNHVGDGWLSEAEAGFLPVDDSPMGFGIRAVPADTPDAKDIEWARRRVSERSRGSAP